LETRFPVASPQQNKPGDEVFYAGSILRQGTNSEFHLVDERIVGKKPKLLSFAQAAALPLTSIIAWELLLDRLGALPGRSVDPRTLLITGGAGGVGSILIQLALDKNQTPLQCGSPHLERLRVFWRVVPFAQVRHRGKLDDHDVLHRWAALGDLSGTAANQITAAILRNRFGGDRAIRFDSDGIAHFEF
jgi:hypothetical protein